MSQQSQPGKYEKNYDVLERITESLNKDEIGIDDLVEKTREALGAARTCMEILNSQKGEFQKLETEFSQLLRNSQEEPVSRDSGPQPPAGAVNTSVNDNVSNDMNSDMNSDMDKIGQDDPF
ncbi:MAG: exodeoxyribonuclease VII small subunit [bacterium]|nr:exodeoxyribonuclease VII small subunit [bacterium]